MTQVIELERLETAARVHSAKLQARLTTLTANHERIYKHLANARKREFELEQRLGVDGATTRSAIDNEINEIQTAFTSNLSEDSAAAAAVAAAVPPSSSSDHATADANGSGGEGTTAAGDDSSSSSKVTNTSSSSSSSSPPSRDNEKDKEPAHIASIAQLTLQQAQTRAKETQAELDDARASLDDLILEIEAISAEEAKSREQCAKVVVQMNENQSMQRAVLEENLRLHDQVAELEKKQIEVESRYSLGHA